jgi:hypothetical protein
MDHRMQEERWNTWDAAVNFPAGIAKLRPEQIANRLTWGVVPDKDMTKAAQHSIRVVPKHGYTVAWVNELDPGISTETVGEGEWREPPRGDGSVAVHGRCMR